jgi:hypothetical protein
MPKCGKGPTGGIRHELSRVGKTAVRLRGKKFPLSREDSVLFVSTEWEKYFLILTGTCLENQAEVGKYG